MIMPLLVTILCFLVIFSILIRTPFIKKLTEDGSNKDRRNELNHELYDIRLKEVSDDVEQGVVVDQDGMIAELQHNLLDDIDENTQRKQNTTQKIWLPGVIFLILTSLALYWSVGSYKAVNDWQSSVQRYPDIHKKLFEQPDVQPNEQELKDLMLGLRSHLAEQPNDAQGWVLYSRLGRVFKDKELALGAIEKAIKAAPQNIEIELEYIELKMKVGDEYSQATAQSMLVNFLQRHPENYDAWSMYGFIALQQENFSAAIERWKKMLTLVKSNSEKAKMLKSSIEYAQKQLALKSSPKIDVQETNSLNTEKGSYEVIVNINDKVIYSENSTLFIYAQSTTGSAMPIAAIKLQIKNFPVKVSLSDANAMMQGVKLSDHEEFVVKARISVDGTVNKVSGQWAGKSTIIKAGTKDVIYIEINERS